MSYSRNPLVPPVSRPATTQWTVHHRNAPALLKAEPRPTRRVNIQWLDSAGQIRDAVRLAPTGGIFDTLFTAFARGTLVPCPTGPVAVEDLLPGDLIETTDGPMALQWIGSTALVPQSGARDTAPLGLFRIAADALGLGRPMPDLMLGAGARILNRGGAAQSDHGASGVLQGIAVHEDGDSIVALNPASSVRLFHLAFEEHRTFLANGVEVESMHPGPLSQTGLEASQMPLLRGLLPHIRQYGDLGRLRFPREDDTPGRAAGF
jgi:hypothetical protein